ncbi:PaaI family thioesterase [Sporobolomyces salmoneus]|uniref:PaaI family thioesterase n=1 Tax=Sporobolomyces salmoneus TaxID=183962 RepID=UPI00317DFEF4
MSSLFRRTPISATSRPLLARRTTPPRIHLSTTSSNRPTLPSTPPTQPQKRSLFLLSSALLSGGLLAGLGLSLVLPRPQIVNLVFPVPTPHPPPSTSREAAEHSEELEQGLWELPIVKALQSEMIPATSPLPSESSLSSPSSNSTATSPADTPLVPRWKISRPYAATPAGPHSLSGYALKGPHKFAIPPLVFTSPDKKEAVFILHVGKGLCGHEGVIHGGLLATVLDESLGRTALLNLPTNIGVTATLNLKYKKPTFAAQYIVIKTQLVDQKGRKAWVKGRIENTEGENLVEAEALFVEPKMARFLSNSSVREALK